VITRSARILILACYALAALALIAAIAAVSNPASISAAWIASLAAVAFLYLAVRIQGEFGTLNYLLQRTEQDRDALQHQVDQQQQSIDTLADGLDVAIFICDLRGNVEYANKRAVDMFRFSNPLGRSLLAVTLSYDLERLVLDAVRLKEAQDAELSFSYPDERVGLVGAWIPTEDPKRVFVSVFETTNLRRLERIRQDFVSNVSHELRTPLTGIRAMAETLMDDEEPNPDLLQRYLPKIVSEVDRLVTISNDLLMLSTAESTKVRKTRCDFAEVIRGVLAPLGEKARAKNLNLVTQLPEHLFVAANPGQMAQVAINLIDNALNYTSVGSVDLHLRQVADQAVFSVKDTGIGIASEHVPRIFERFYRVDKARSRSTGGTGLGLSIVKHIVEAHGGTVKIDSALNQGSTFTVEIPVGDPADTSTQES